MLQKRNDVKSIFKPLKYQMGMNEQLYDKEIKKSNFWTEISFAVNWGRN